MNAETEDGLTQSVAALATALEVLAANLLVLCVRGLVLCAGMLCWGHHQSTQKSGADILTILEKVDNRLSSLEQNMGPIRRVTEQLTLAEQNVIKTYDKLNSIHDNFKVMSEADAMLRRGLLHRASIPADPAAMGGDDDAGLEAYIEVVDRVYDAMSFLRRNIKMRSADVTLRQLEVKHQRLLGDMKDEIYRLLSSGSQTVIVKGQGGFMASDPISGNLAKKVKVMCEAMHRTGDSRWTEAYLKARRVKIDIAIRNFHEKQKEQTPAAPGTTDPTTDAQSDWLKFLQFLRELVRGEEIIMTRALPKIKESSDAYMDLVNPPVVKLCTDAAEALEQIISKERSPGDKAVILLSLLQGVKAEMPAFRELLRGQANNESNSPPLAQVESLHVNLCRKTIAALAAFAGDVQGDSTATKNLPLNATVHVVTSNTLRSFKKLLAFQSLFEELSRTSRLPWETSDGEPDPDDSRLRVYGQHIFHCLLSNLRQKADALKKVEGMDALSAAGRPHVFLMNNANYMTKAFRGEGGDGIRSPTASRGSSLSSAHGSNSNISSLMSTVLPEAFVDRLGRLVEEEREKFNTAVWVPLIEPLRDVNALHLEYSKGTNVLTLESGRQIKSRFTNFNTSLEEVYQHQKLFSVPDASLRQRLRQQAKDTVVRPYTTFFNKVSEIQFSKKHMEQYLRFPPKTVTTMLDDLFSG